MNGFLYIDFLRRTKVVKNFYIYSHMINANLNTEDYLLAQKDNLIKLLIHLKRNNYYKKYLVAKSDITIKLFPYEVLSELPIMDKESVKLNFSVLTDTNYAHEKSYTGGSTGAPFHYLVDKKSITATRAFSYFLWNHFLGYTFGDKIIVIAGDSLGSNRKFVSKAYNFLQNKTFIDGSPVNEKNALKLVDFVNRSSTGLFIYAYPSSLVQYIGILLSLNLTINRSNVKGIICTSEMLFDDKKELIETYFNAKVLNMYGANDGGIASGSIDNINFMYNGLDCFAENVLNGQVNELVLTNLKSFAFPLVRYKVGDIAEIAFHEDSYPFYICNLIGRTRDFIYVDKFVKIHGSTINKLLKDYIFVRKYQIEQYEDLNCIIRIVLDSNLFDSEKFQELNERFVSLLQPVDVKLDIVDIIDDSVSGKHKSIISHVK